MVNKTRNNNFNKALTSIEKAVAKDPSWIITTRSKYRLILTRNTGTYCMIIAYFTDNEIGLFIWEEDVAIRNIKDASTLKKYVSRIMPLTEIGEVVTMIHNINIEKSLDELG